MIPPLKYDIKTSVFVESFLSLDSSKHSASYWESKDNKSLQDFKTTIKNYCKKAQNYRCAYCKQRISVEHNAVWDIEHIVARKTKPKWMFDSINLCIACKDCNGEKSDKNVLKNTNLVKVPLKASAYLIIHPYLELYEDHIHVISEGEFYLPRTEKGRKTVEICGLTRFFLKMADIRVGDSNDILMLTIVNQISEAKSESLRGQLLSLLEGLARGARQRSVENQLSALQT